MVFLVAQTLFSSVGLQVIDVGVPYLKVDDIEKVAILLLRGIASLDEKDL